MPVSDNGLETTVGDLSARLTRLEGLVLEMTSQLVPALTNIALKQLVEPVQLSDMIWTTIPWNQKKPTVEAFPHPGKTGGPGYLTLSNALLGWWDPTICPQELGLMEFTAFDTP